MLCFFDSHFASKIIIAYACVTWEGDVCVCVQSKMELAAVLWYQVYLENMHLLREGR